MSAEQDQDDYMNFVHCKGRDCEKQSKIEGGFSRSESLKYHEWTREDAHGIYTGHYCDDCYENNYPYRKDKYPTMEDNGYGEYLESDY